MSSLDRIELHLGRLARRQRGLLLLRAGLQLEVVLVVAVLVPAVLLSVGLESGVAFAAGAVLGLAGGALVLRPVVKRWGPTGTLAAQARCVEALEPGLEQRLATVVGRAPVLRTATPPPLLVRAADRAWALAEPVTPAQVHPTAPLHPWGLAVGLSLLVLGLSSQVLPVGPDQLFGILMGASVAETRLADAGGEVGDERVVVGDIVLRYVFPGYTGAEPVEVRNSDGTIHAPPGTRVEISARTERVFDMAALQVDDLAPVDARLVSGRDVYAALDVDQAGVWRFVFFQGDGAFMSADFSIEVEDDTAPVVALERSPPARVPVDGRVPLSWSAQDDFGIQRVVLEVVRPDGTVEEHVLRTPLDPERGLQGGLSMTPRDLGMKPGQSAKLRIVAYDNDVMGGNKRGVSPEVEVQAEGRAGQGANLAQHMERVRDALLIVLADFLEDPGPDADSAAAVQAWVISARTRFDPVRAIQHAQWGDEGSVTFDAQVVANVEEAASKLFRFAITTWEPGSRRRITDADAAQLADLIATVVSTTETAVYALDMLVRQKGMADIAEQAEVLAREAGELAAMADDVSQGEMLARLDRLDQMLAELAAAAASLGEGGLREYVNSRTAEARNLQDDVRKAIAEGRMDDARDLMEQLAEQLRQLSEGINDQVAQQQTGDDSAQQEMEATMEELTKLEADQRALMEELQARADELGDGVAEQVAQWKELDALAGEIVKLATDAVDATADGRGWRAESVRALETSRLNLGNLKDAVQARDVERALERAYQAQRPASRAERAARMESERERPASQPRPDGLDLARGNSEQVLAKLDQLAEKLEELIREQESSSPEVEQAAQQIAGQQSQLSQRQSDLEQKVREVEQSMPLAQGDAASAMKQAGDAMGRAEDVLQQGDALGGQGHQEEAADRLKEAREHLESAQQQQQQMQQAQQQMQGQQPSGSQEGDQPPSPAPQAGLDLPLPEDFQTPEEYRRALLEGMAGEVPDEYRTLNRRYFEELVRQ